MDLIADKFKKESYLMGKVDGKSNSLFKNINLGIGDLDIDTPDIIIEKTINDIRGGHTHYTNPYGYDDLRDKIVEYHKENFENYNFEKKDVLVTTGACHGLYLLFKSILNRDDEIILLAPFFPVYAEQIRLSDGIPVVVKTKFENEFQLVEEDIKIAISPKTKAIVLNSPCNPTGICYNEKSLNIIKKISEEYDLLVIADEVYDFYNFKNRFKPMYTLENMDKRTISICSFSKNFAMTGWRIGYAISKVPKLIETMESINESIIYSPPSISQRAGFYALTYHKDIKNSIVDIFEKRVKYCYERVKNIPYMSVVEPQGGIYLFINIEKTKLSSLEFTKYVYDKLNINVIAGDGFGMSGFVRIACTLDIELLKEAFDRFEKIEF